jgi:C4-dicarboxylate transporter/malic acid transport protein
MDGMGILMLGEARHHRPSGHETAGGSEGRTRRILRGLERPSELFANLGPNWFATIMGTGIIATAGATLPVQFPALRALATLFWAAASVLLLLLTASTLVHWTRHRDTARGHHGNPVMAHFYGAPPMALLTVGAGTLLLGKDVLGEQLALRIDAVLWVLGTLLGLASAFAVPYLQFTRHKVSAADAFGGWLMPVVPPMVSASTGALLLPYLPAGEARQLMLMACYAMFGLSLLASLLIIPLIWQRLAVHKNLAAAAVPTLWIVLGPLGQSITAANLLAFNAHHAVSGTLLHALEAFGVLYGVPVLGFALLWATLAAAITLRTARSGLPFTLAWWSFTFPVGTCITGLSGLAAHTGLGALTVLAAVGYVLLLGAWLVVAVRTFRGSVLEGTLFQAPVAPAALLKPTAVPVQQSA